MFRAMSDCFALLGQERRPWLEEEALKKKFLSLSTQFHPDRVHGAGEAEKRAAQQTYAQLNQAYQTLRHHKPRLQHLLELETGAKPAQVQQVPEGLMDFFLAVARLFKETDVFLAEKAQKSSPLLQVRLFETAQEWIEKLKEFQRQLGQRQQELVADLKHLDARWAPTATPAPDGREELLKDLERCYRLCSYYAKWEAQAQERIVQLSL